jgi:hypothetical protein
MASSSEAEPALSAAPGESNPKDETPRSRIAEWASCGRGLDSSRHVADMETRRQSAAFDQGRRNIFNG